VVSSLEFMPETDISAVDTWAFSFVWTYLNGLDDGRIEKLNQAAFKVWDYISYFGIPLDSRFVVRYLLRLFYLVPMDSINSDVMVYCQQLYDILKMIPLAMKTRMILFEGNATPGYPGSIVDRVFVSMLRARSAPVSIYTTPYLNYRPISPSDAKKDDILAVRPPRVTAGNAESNVYYFTLTTDAIVGASKPWIVYNVNGPVRGDTITSGTTSIAMGLLAMRGRNVWFFSYTRDSSHIWTEFYSDNDIYALQAYRRR
jgi:hypothetical protein